MRKEINAVAVPEIQVNKEGTLAIASAIILEVVMSIMALYFVHLIGECAGLWHHGAGLSRDLWRYYGAVSYAGHAAKSFGFRKTCWNIILAIGCEAAMLSFISKRLGLKLFQDTKVEPTRESILSFGLAIHVIVYIGVAIFSRSSSMYGPLQSGWEHSRIYASIAAHDRTWILFWALACIVLTLLIQTFAAKNRNHTVVLYLLMIVGLIAVGAYFNAHDIRTLGDVVDFSEDVAILIEEIGEKIF